MIQGTSVALLTVGVVIGLAFHAFMYGPQAAYITEQFPARLRYAGSSLAYTLAGVVGGAVAPLIFTALYGAASGDWYLIAVYIALTAVITIVGHAPGPGPAAGRRTSACSMTTPRAATPERRGLIPMETVSNPATAARVLAVRPVGTTAVLAELSGLHDVLALQALLLEQPLPGQLDVLAAAETVMVRADSPASARRIAALLLELDLTLQSQREGDLVVIDTVYDGEDLAEVGRAHRPRDRGSGGRPLPGRSGQWPSPASRRASATWWGRTRRWKSRAGVHRGPPSPPVRWRWPAITRPCTRGSPRAAGS